MTKILAIDDQEFNLVSLKAIIKIAFPDSVLYTATDGISGIELALVHNPDVILLDICMPEIDGFEVCRRLKLEEQLLNTPVVFITALTSDKESRIKALEVGADGFLSKPIDKTELTAQIRAMIKVKAANLQKHQEKVDLKMLVAERTIKLEQSRVETLDILNELKIENETRQQAELQLRKSEAEQHESMKLFQQLFNVSPDAIILIDPNDSVVPWSILDCNIAACEMNGYSREELVGNSIDMLNERIDSIDFHNAYLDNLRIKGITKEELNHRHKDGHIFTVEVVTSIVKFAGRELVLGIDRDITERKKAELALQESEFFFKKSQKAASIGSYKFDIVAGTWESSEVLDHIFGIDKYFERNFQAWQGMLHPDDKEMMENYFGVDVLTNHKPFNKEYRIIRKSDGQSRWIYGLGELDFDNEGTVISMFGTIQDITERKLAEEITREAEERFRMVFENVFDGICIYDEDPDPFKRKLIDCNEQYAAMSGLSRESLLMSAYTQKLQIPLEDQSNELRLESLDLGRAYSGSYSWNRPDGKDNVIEYIGVPVKWKGKSYSIGIDRDITYRKRAEESLNASHELTNLLLQTIPYAMDIVDEEGNILFMNKNMEQFFDQNTIGQKCWELYCDDKAQCANCPLLEGVKIGKTALLETTNMMGRRSFQISHTGMLFQGKMAVLEIFQDITDKKHMLSSLIAAKDKAEESDRLKSAFLANLSHEIRTPLNSIIGFSELMTELDNSNIDQYFQFARKINLSGNNLLSIFTDIMEISKIEAGQIKLKMEMISVNQLMNELKNEYTFKAIGKGLDFVMDQTDLQTEILIKSDRAKLKQIFVNLIGNAIKFTKEGFIQIGIHNTTKSVEFYVKDTGIGISKDFHEVVFERFRQVEEANTRKFGGNGLGLSISKSLVELLGGSLRMESEQWKGSTFFFTIPL